MKGKFDIEKINAQLERCANPQKESWARGIIQTRMPMLVVMSADINAILKTISADEVVPYLEAETFRYYENTIIFAKTLHRVRDFELFKHYLYKLISVIDNWATVDAILWQTPLVQVQSLRSSNYNGRQDCALSSGDIAKCDSARLQGQSVQADDFCGRQDCLFELSKTLLLDARPFARRTGVRILFKYLDDDNINGTLALVKTMKNETEYYVNMCIAWLLCESFIKQREKTLTFLSLDNVSEFVLRKTISKCCDSFRVTAVDKTMLRALLK